MKRILIAAVVGAFAALLAGCPQPGPPGPAGPPGPGGPPADIEPVTSVEACIGCHGPDGAVPVVDINTPGDAHHIDTNSNGPLTQSGYRTLDLELTLVDVRGSQVIIEFEIDVPQWPYVRAVVTSGRGDKAWTNPIFL